MKILLDPITTNDPQFCVMNYKMKCVVEYLVEKYDDVFFYWLIPEQKAADIGEWDVDKSWFPHPDRVKLIEVPVNKDRYSGYLRMNDAIFAQINYRGFLWDFDMVITARVIQAPFMRVWMHKTGTVTHTLRRIVTVDDMPVMSFKKCVNLTRDMGLQDRLTINGYLAANRNCFISFWEKDEVAKWMRRYFSAAMIREFLGKSYDTSPILVEAPTLKPKAFVKAAHTQSKPLTVGYTQRWEVVHRKSADIIEIMEKQYAYHAHKRPMRFLVSSNSKGAQNAISKKPWIEGIRAPREEFWRIMREEVDVILILTVDDDYSMSMIEPLMLGTPAIVLDAQYVKPTLGADYPFIVKNDTEAYALLNMFAEDYVGMYARFAKWQWGTFKDLMLERNKVWLAYQIEAEMMLYRQELASYGIAKEDHPVTTVLVPDFPDDFVMDDEVIRAFKEKRLTDNLYDIRANSRYRQNFDYHEWYRWRVDLISRHGYVDASPKPGHLRKAT